MPITTIDPEGLAPIPGASHLTVATGTRIVHVSGQTGTDASGALVSDALGGQVAQALRNLRLACDAAGGSLADVAMLRMYVVDYTPAALDEIVGAAIEVLGEDFPITASTLVGVATLWQPGILFEVDAVLVLD